MPARIELTAEHQNGQAIELGEVVALDGLGEGVPVMLTGTNSGNMTVRGIAVHCEGEGSEYVQLAIDDGGVPGVWAAPGEGISIREDSLFPGDKFHFWAKAVYDPDQMEGQFEFEFVVEGTSIGS